MANRYMGRTVMALEKMPCSLWGKVSIGALGAPTLDALKSKGICKLISAKGYG